VPEVGRAFNATKDARASISENKYALYTISDLVLEQATILPLAIFESIINIPSSNSNGAVISVILIAKKVRVMAAYGAVIES
jgi:hypothetical protein